MRRSDCNECMYNQITKCKVTINLSDNEYEDYFVDRIKHCPYRKTNKATIKEGDNINGKDGEI